MPQRPVSRAAGWPADTIQPTASKVNGCPSQPNLVAFLLQVRLIRPWIEHFRQPEMNSIN